MRSRADRTFVIYPHLILQIFLSHLSGPLSVRTLLSVLSGDKASICVYRCVCPEPSVVCYYWVSVISNNPFHMLQERLDATTINAQRNRLAETLQEIVHGSSSEHFVEQSTCCKTPSSSSSPNLSKNNIQQNPVGWHSMLRVPCTHCGCLLKGDRFKSMDVQDGSKDEMTKSTPLDAPSRTVQRRSVTLTRFGIKPEMYQTLTLFDWCYNRTFSSFREDPIIPNTISSSPTRIAQRISLLRPRNTIEHVSDVGTLHFVLRSKRHVLVVAAFSS